jgi:hypothetical protein
MINVQDSILNRCKLHTPILAICRYGAKRTGTGTESGRFVLLSLFFWKD